jgi:hypothetical protein
VNGVGAPLGDDDVAVRVLAVDRHRRPLEGPAQGLPQLLEGGAPTGVATRSAAALYAVTNGLVEP